MASLHDLASLIASRRAALERAFDSEILKLKASYGAAAVERALHIARQIKREKQPEPPPIPCGWPAQSKIQG